MPCHHPVVKNTAKLKNPNYPKELNTLGDHLRKKRLDLNLFQKNVAQILSTTTDTITNWEKNRCEPEIRYIPKIMDFLGYCPIQHPKTWGERLELYRVHQGLSYRKLAGMIGVDPGGLAKAMREGERSGYFWERVGRFWEKFED